MSTSLGKLSKRGRGIQSITRSGLAKDSTQFADSDRLVMEMTEQEREDYFDRLVLLVKLEGRIQ